MTAEVDQASVVEANRDDAEQRVRDPWRWASVFLVRNWFSSLTRRIVFFNLAALIILLSGMLYLNQFRAGLIDARVQSLLTQGEIIAGAIASAAAIDNPAVTIDPEQLLELKAGESVSPVEDQINSLDFPINPERAAPILRKLISPTRTRARLYDRDGGLIVDSRNLFASGQILRFDLPPLKEAEPDLIEHLWQMARSWIRRGDLPLYEELPPDEGRGYSEVVAALNGVPVSIVRVNEKGELIVIVSVPVTRFRAVLGALVLSTQGGDIDSIVNAERWAIFRVFLVAVGVTILLSLLLASTIAEPVRRLAAAAERVRKGVSAREEIPDFTSRRDEIGHLSGALRDMTGALYDRMDATERFAADVAHELKNPLTSLRSAVETLPLAKTQEAHDRLLQIVQNDVRRLDRLISDISAASRLDAELSRQETAPIEMDRLVETVADLFKNAVREITPNVTVVIESPRDDLIVLGHDLRLSQVVNNILDNARSFSPPDGMVRISVGRIADKVRIRVDDDGQGMPADAYERIFERFYTDRPGPDSFGENSGLGLSISKQIVEAHGGSVVAANRHDGEGRVIGARFDVFLPMARNAR